MRFFSRLTVDAFALFFIGFSLASFQPFQSLFATSVLNFSEQGFAILLFFGSVVNMIAAIYLGYFIDTRGRAKNIIISVLFCGIVAFFLINRFETYLLYFILYCTFIPIFITGYSLHLAFIKANCESSRNGNGQQSVAFARSLFTVAWVIAPAVAAYWLEQGFKLGVVFVIAAGAAVVASVLVMISKSNQTPPVPEGSAPSRQFRNAVTSIFHKRVGQKVVAAGLIQTAHLAHAILMPILVVGRLHGQASDVGRVFALVAAVEIPAMFLITFTFRYLSRDLSLVVGAMLFALYLFLLGIASTVQQVYLLVPLNAVSSATILLLSIGYLQETIERQISLSTALVSVAHVFGSGVSAVVIFFGNLVFPSTRPLLFVFALICAAGALFVFMEKGTKNHLLSQV